MGSPGDCATSEEHTTYSFDDPSHQLRIGLEQCTQFLSLLSFQHSHELIESRWVYSLLLLLLIHIESLLLLLLLLLIHGIMRPSRTTLRILSPGSWPSHHLPVY